MSKRPEIKSLEWGSAGRIKVNNKIGAPISSSGSDGDMEVWQSRLGAKLFTKVGGRWRSTNLSNNEDNAINIGSKASDQLSISQSTIRIIKNSSQVLTINNSGYVGINDVSPDNQLHITNTSGVAKEVIKLEQLDVDEPFILFTGTSASDQTKSITTDTSVGSLTGHILVSINGTDYWVPFYAQN